MAVLLRHVPKKAAPAPAPVPMPVLMPVPMPVPAPPAAANATAPPPLSVHPPVVVMRSSTPVSETSVFNIDNLMRVMGRDAKGRAIMVKMVRAAIEGGTAPADQAALALSEGRLGDAARVLHGLRGAVGVLGARRLIQATIDAEHAINGQRATEFEALQLAVRHELELTLAQAREWLAQQS